MNNDTPMLIIRTNSTRGPLGYIGLVAFERSRVSSEILLASSAFLCSVSDLYSVFAATTHGQRVISVLNN